MSISHKKSFSVDFGSTLGVLDLSSTFLAGLFSQRITAWTLQYSSVQKGGREEVKSLYLHCVLQKKLFLVIFSSFLGVPLPLKILQTCPFMEPINHSSPNDDDMSTRTDWSWFGFSHD